MKRTFDRTQLGPSCMVCGKSRVASVNKPHSQKRTKRVVKPNVQTMFGLMVCTRCLRSMKRAEAAQRIAPVVSAKIEVAPAEIAPATV
jgi:ribosomal protein L28